MATVTAYVGDKSQNIATTKDVYLVPSTTTVSYGNINLLANASGEDAFASDTDYKTAIDANSAAILAGRAKALNIALGRGDKEKDVPQFTETLDYDKDGKMVLAEYRIFKLLMEGDPIYTPSELKNARASWATKAAAAAEK